MPVCSERRHCWLWNSLAFLMHKAGQTEMTWLAAALGARCQAHFTTEAFELTAITLAKPWVMLELVSQSTSPFLFSLCSALCHLLPLAFCFPQSTFNLIKGYWNEKKKKLSKWASFLLSVISKPSVNERMISWVYAKEVFIESTPAYSLCVNHYSFV